MDRCKPCFAWVICWEVWIPARAGYVSMLTVQILPLPPITWLVYGENQPSLLSTFMVMVDLLNLIPEHCFVSAQSHCHMDLWSAWLVLTHYHHLHRQFLPLHQYLMRKSKSTFLSQTYVHIIHYKDCAWFRLNICRVSKGLFSHYSREPG